MCHIIYCLLYFQLIYYISSTELPISRFEFYSPLLIDRSKVKLSYDGKWVAFIGKYDGVTNLFIQMLPNGPTRRLLKNQEFYLPGDFFFAYDNKTIVYGYDFYGNGSYHTYGTNVDTEETKMIFTGPETILASSFQKPFQLVFGRNERNPLLTDAYLIDISNGSEKLLFENNYYDTLSFDDQLNLKVGANLTNKASKKFFYIKGDGEVKLIKQTSPYDATLTDVLKIDNSGIIYWRDNDNVDKAGLVSLNPQTNERNILYFAKKADIEDVYFHPVTGRPLWLYEKYGQPELKIIDKKYEADFQKFETVTTSRNYIKVQMSADENVWLLEIRSDNKLPVYYIYNKTSEDKELYYLFSARDDWINRTFSKTYTYDVVTSDGMVEVCFLTLPPDMDNNGLPCKPLPTILMVHGGPQTCTYWEPDPFADKQFWATRYAVLDCNFRGSTCYGKVLLSSGVGQWGQKMQQDLTDAIKWSIAMNITDPKKVAILGGSYGGYAAYAGVTFTPDLYTCAVAEFAPVNVKNFIETQNKEVLPFMGERLKPMKNWFMSGDPDSIGSDEFLRSRSPIFFADRIKTPILIVHGELDRNVRISEAEDMVSVLKNLSTSVTFVRYPDVGHGAFYSIENGIANTAIIDEFLGKCMGVKYEPITDEIKNSTAVIQKYHTS